MTVLTSSIHHVRKALRDALRDDPAFQDVLVWYGPPAVNPPDEFVWCGNARATQQHAPHAGPGPHRRREAYELEVIVSVLRHGALDNEEAAERAYSLVAAIEKVLRTNPTLAGYYNGAGQIISLQFGGVRDDDQRADGQKVEAFLRCVIEAQVRL